VANGRALVIDRRDLLELANTLGLRPNVVEKDYIQILILAGIYRDPEIATAWIFKGGTCLKKCYFETYRFSEDLDFTISDDAHASADFLKERFASVSDWVQERAGIELPIDLLKFDLFQNKQGRPQGEGRIAYRGPLAPGGDLPRIKLDLTFHEKLVLPPVVRPVAHPYADRDEGDMQARCYAYPEVFGEKIRALGERARPRDLYDVINLFRNGEFRTAASIIRDVLRQKCAFKNIPVPTLVALEAFKAEIIADWEQMLAHQLPQLPPVEAFWSALPEFFAWLEGGAERAAVVPYRLGTNERVLRGPAGGLPIPYRASSHIEIIRFAATNQLLVELDYQDEKGQRSTRLIEPYSLRQSADGDISLVAFALNRNDWRHFRLDRIQGARVTSQSFTPRYEIELTPTGMLSAPPISRPSSGALTYRSSAPRLRQPGPARLKQTSYPGAPTYTYRCPLCRKTFQRKTMDSHLNPHKNNDGWPCPGTYGIYEGTKF
jgi:predicted nucleotidyltransferase component of viral defense system